MADRIGKIGFIGLGLMGIPMVQNLIKKTPETTQFFVYDVVDDVLEKFCDEHPTRAKAVKSSREVAEQAEVILSMVPEGSHVRTVYLTPETGVLASDVSGKILIDCSTIDTATSLAVREETLKRYPTASFYDTPVSGGVLGAERGSLTFMIGCSEEDPKLALLKAILAMMGKTLVACGGPSLGLTAKLCNNYCSGLIAIAVCEAMNIGIKSGMDPRVLANVFHSSTAQSAICDDWCPVPGLCPGAPASNGYQGGFRVQLMRKDFALAVDTAEDVGAQLALGQSGLHVYTSAMNDPRCKDLDSRVVYRYLGGVENWQDNLKLKK
ncbi:3-hydroxyisobutyrate dehydrogenase [Venturia nashicola]|uniref:3-hydroxyisobutyrate dehydrogenase n=1 Tax=Venturia nashicola TaxID=86259 RepID=A0A4Z1NG27_9PEZI|nr:3-hydroxyisobutyrate dehydrogenase [Venturia nashicola]TLD20110.1 3-hydroxyisobutyrate dehydrogenase [Venturia nashicola]